MLFCEHGDSRALVQTVGTHEAEASEVMGMLVAGGGMVKSSSYDERRGKWSQTVEKREFTSQVGYVVSVGEMMRDMRVKLKGETTDWC